MALICKQVNVSATTHVFSDKAKTIIERISHLPSDWITRYGLEALDLCPTLQILCYTVTEQDCDYDYTTILTFMSKVTQLDVLNAYFMRGVLDDDLMCTPSFVMPTSPENILRNVDVVPVVNTCVEQLQPTTISSEIPYMASAPTGSPVSHRGGKKRTGKACAQRSALKFRKMMNVRQASEDRAATIVRLFGEYCGLYGYDINGYPLPKQDVPVTNVQAVTDVPATSTSPVVEDVVANTKVDAVLAYVSDTSERPCYPRFIVQCENGCSVRHDGFIPFTRTRDSKTFKVRHDFEMVVITHVPKPYVPVSYGYFTNDTMWRRSKPGIVYTDNMFYAYYSANAFIYTDVMHTTECYKLQMPSGRIVQVPLTMQSRGF